MTDNELRRDFIRMSERRHNVEILVRVISWGNPYTSVSNWVVGATIENPASDNQVDEAIKKLVRRRKFFGVCNECGEREPRGYMHTATLCQKCAVNNHGIVY